MLQTNISLSEGNSTVCGEDNYNYESYPINLTALPSSPDANKLCPSPELQSGGNFRQIQHNSLTEPCQQGRPGMMGGFHNSSNGSTRVHTGSLNNNTFRCIQPGLGSSSEWSVPHRGHMVCNLQHQLLGVVSCFLSNQGFRKTWQNITALL